MTMAGPQRFQPPPARNGLERALSLVTDIHAGEGATALLLAANIFCIIAFYSVVKVVRDALILAESGAVIASYAAAGQALILLALVPVYGAVASRVNRVKLVCGVTAFFASHLVLFYLLGAAGTRLGIVFYLWAGVFNLIVTAQFWAFANDVYTSERGRRLFPIVGLGASLGAVVGAGLTYLGFEQVGAYRLMLIAAFGLLIPVGLTLWVNTRERRLRDAASDPSDGNRSPTARAEAPLAPTGGFQLIFQQRYLTLIALLMVLVNVVNTLGGFLLNTIIVTEATTLVASGAAPGLEVREVAGRLSAGIQTWVNTLGLLFQALLVSRIFKYMGVRGALFILPIIALGGYAAVALLPLVGVVKFVKILENSTDYSIQNTTRNALFLPTSREAKYKAKQAIDSFFWRAGDLLQAGVVFAGTALALTLRHFALLNVVFALALLFVVVMLFREHKKVTVGVVEERAA
jgi:ATP:ADP antiporter, AAA family